jgi:hypothetical protein
MEKKYEFKQFKSREHYTGIKIAKTYTNIAQSLMAEMGQPSRVLIEVDNTNNAIKITPTNSQNSFKVKNNKASSSINTRLWRALPMGRYFYTEEADGGYICVLGSNTNNETNYNKNLYPPTQL